MATSPTLRAEPRRPSERRDPRQLVTRLRHPLQPPVQNLNAAEIKQPDRQSPLRILAACLSELQLTGPWPTSRPTRATTPFLPRPQGQHEATFSMYPGRPSGQARSPRPKRQRVVPAADCGAHPASGKQTLRRSSSATCCRILCLGGGSGSLILVSCRLARWWLRSVRCWAARTHCSATRRPPGKDPPRAR